MTKPTLETAPEWIGIKYGDGLTDDQLVELQKLGYTGDKEKTSVEDFATSKGINVSTVKTRASHGREIDKIYKELIK